MEQGVIRSLKAHYRKRVVRKLITALDKNVSLQTASMLDAMNMRLRKINPTEYEMTSDEIVRVYHTLQPCMSELDRFHLLTRII